MLDPVLPKRFQFIRQLGEGGMGVVYEALDRERGERVAVKTVRDLTAESLARFKAEFRALADVHHPNVVTLGELFSEGRDWYFSMELVEGSDFLAYVRPTDARRGTEDTLPVASVSSDGAIALMPRPRVPRFASAAPRFDEARLRSALRQLADALAALHAAGVVHRDVKPSNVRITDAGRLVLLDFGLAIDATKDRSNGMRMGGTPAYMAPEQALSGAVGPEADWYGVGVVLYEALTGGLPFDGAPFEIMTQKQSHAPEPPRTRVPDVPADLDSLCVALLEFDPTARPTAARVHRMLGTTEGLARASRSSLIDQAPFVGRSDELDVLRRAYQDTREGMAVSVLVEGESGVGKSCLVRRFVTTLRAEQPDLIVLAGRCYEREAMPYKALDGVVDALTHVLLREGNSLAMRVLPTRPGPLAQVFPVLRRVDAFGDAARGPAAAADPVDLRNRAFAAMRELLARLALARPCIVIIDDLQWADADSLALLAEIMLPPDEPPLLLVGTIRTPPPGESTAVQDATGSNAFLAALGGRARRMPMTRMPEEDAKTLAVHLLKREGTGSGQSAEAIAREAAGHPLFIEALVRHSSLAGAPLASTLLEEALWARVASLPDGPRQVMKILAVAGGPVTQEVLAEAVGGDRAELRRHVSLLRVAHLASITGARANDRVEPYHDRVRAAILANIADADRVACHRAMAIALEKAPRREVESLARHWRGAGENAQAATYAELAAEEASGALAFDRAAALYATALELGQHSDTARSTLFERLGDALANAGRGERAAAAYGEASRGTQAARALDLQRRGADQLVRSGHFDEGLASMRRVLASIGLALPRSPLSALLFLIAYRMYLRVRGLGFRARDASEISATDLTRIDVCWSLAFGLGVADTLRGAAFQARNLVLALRSGERYRIARAVAAEAIYSSLEGGRANRRTEWLLQRAHALAAESREPHAIGWAEGASGAAYFMTGRFERALEHLERARAVWAEVPGAVWELDTTAHFSTMCLVQLGQIARVVRETPQAVREARQRGDLYAAVNLRVGLPNLAWLAMGGAEAALAQADEAMSEWSKRGFHLEHYYELLARTHALLYAGRAREAHAYVLARWPALRRSLLSLTIQSTRIQTLHARARSAIAAAEEGGADRAILLRDAATMARRVEREGVAWAAPWAKLLRAGIAATRGAMRRQADERAAALLREAISGFDAASMALYAAAARRCLGGLLRGDEGRQLSDGADAWMRTEMIKDPARMTAMLAPGFSRLVTGVTATS